MLAINKIYDELLSNIDQGRDSCCIFLDLSKAFDTVNHKILLQKLENFFGFRGTSLKLMENYPTDRYQRIPKSVKRGQVCKKRIAEFPKGLHSAPFYFCFT